MTRTFTAPVAARTRVAAQIQEEEVQSPVLHGVHAGARQEAPAAS